MAGFDAKPMANDDQSSGVVGNVARGSKDSGTGGHELMDFSVRKGDNGGVVVAETYKAKPPAGRRPGAGFPMLGKTKENPFSAKDGAAAMTHIQGLLGQMGVKPPPPPEPDNEEPDEDEAAAAAPPPMPAPGPGPMGAPGPGPMGPGPGGPPMGGPGGPPPPMPPMRRPGL